jgi:hypothetical protein
MQWVPVAERIRLPNGTVRPSPMRTEIIMCTPNPTPAESEPTTNAMTPAGQEAHLIPARTLAAQVNVRRSHHDLGEHGCIVQNIEKQGSLRPPLRH